MNVTLRQLQAFVALAERGSFTQAARTLNLTQSALSLLVRELEGSLGTRLVDRTTRSTSLTEVGREFLPRAQRVLAELSHAVGGVHQLLAKERGQVVVAAPLVLSSTLLPPLLVSFRARHPGIELLLRDTLPDQVLPLVRNGGADLGLGTFPTRQDDLRRQLLFRESLVAVFPRRHALAADEGRPLPWARLAGHAVLTQPRGSVFRDLAELGFAAAGLPLEPAMEAAYVGTLLGLVRAGLGVAIVPGYATALGDRSSLRWRRLERPTVEREVVLVSRAALSLSPAAQALAEHLLQGAASAAAAVMGAARAVAGRAGTAARTTAHTTAGDGQKGLQDG